MFVCGWIRQIWGDDCTRDDSIASAGACVYARACVCACEFVCVHACECERACRGCSAKSQAENPFSTGVRESEQGGFRRMDDSPSFEATRDSACNLLPNRSGLIRSDINRSKRQPVTLFGSGMKKFRDKALQPPGLHGE